MSQSFADIIKNLTAEQRLELVAELQKPVVVEEEDVAEELAPGCAGSCQTLKSEICLLREDIARLQNSICNCKVATESTSIPVECDAFCQFDLSGIARNALIFLAIVFVIKMFARIGSMGLPTIPRCL